MIKPDAECFFGVFLHQCIWTHLSPDGKPAAPRQGLCLAADGSLALPCLAIAAGRIACAQGRVRAVVMAAGVCGSAMSTSSSSSGERGHRSTVEAGRAAACQRARGARRRVAARAEWMRCPLAWHGMVWQDTRVDEEMDGGRAGGFLTVQYLST